MSARTIVYLHCDGPCHQPYVVDPAPKTNQELGDTATYQRECARADGWLVSQPGGLDYCPDCRDERSG